jgi:hypothetical protein
MYTARVIETVANAPGTWNSLRIGVFQQNQEREEQIGEYIRNYSTLIRTFFPFMFKNKHFALYSPDYTATRIMELPSCRDIGGEEPSATGFCPAEYFVPSYVIREYSDLEGKTHRIRKHRPTPDDTQPTVTLFYQADPLTGERVTIEKPFIPITPILYYPFGFIAGCIWGDDSSWKIQYLDLSQADKGIIKRDERFGYIELPDKMALKDAIIPGDYLYNGEYPYMSIVIQQKFNMNTGKMYDIYEDD